MTDAPVQLDRPDERIAVVRLNRPAKRNALDSATLAAFNETLDGLATDAELSALVLSTTNTDALCAGADIEESLDAVGGVARMAAFTRMYAAIDAFPAPVIAVCVGNCVGAGAEIVAGCDLRVGGDNLKLAWAGARLGVPVGPARLAPLVGLSIAKELVFTGRVVGPDEARELRLLHRVAPADEAEAAAVELARDVARNNGSGVRQLKRMFHRDADLPAHVARENEALVRFQREGGGLPQGAGRSQP